jgi:hypothetical protein
VQNYFNYFTEIEERFQRRRGSLLLLSTLDWALIDTWREAGIPLEAALRGIDSAFDKYDARKGRSRVRRINGLAYCAQEVLAAAEDMREAAVGAAPAAQDAARSGLEQERIAAHLEACAAQMAPHGRQELAAAAEPLRAMAVEVRRRQPDLEDLERRLTAMEQKLLAILIAGAEDSEMLELRRRAAEELAPYRSRMPVTQIRQVEQQFLQKMLLEKAHLPRLSLFYMSQQ